MKADDRIITCDKCKITYDKDINVLFEGIKKFVENQNKLNKISDVMIKKIITKIINTD